MSEPRKVFINMSPEDARELLSELSKDSDTRRQFQNDAQGVLAAYGVKLAFPGGTHTHAAPSKDDFKRVLENLHTAPKIFHRLDEEQPSAAVALRSHLAHIPIALTMVANIAAWDQDQSED